MGLDAKSKAKIAFLNEEMDIIHHANGLFWKHQAPTKTAKAEYQFRNERLEKIREELDRIRSS
jgi:Skp family chaperone for outer membrane proteins